MTTQDIDNLSGRELKIKIAEALGYIVSDWPIDDLPNWHSDIAAAWKLDGDGYRFSFTETHAVGGQIICTLVTHPVTGAIVQSTAWKAGNTAAAYARARCEAWLKAKNVEVAQ